MKSPEPTVAVFKTNVYLDTDARKLVQSLAVLLPQSKINFDLADCDNILRIESVEEVDPQVVTQHLSGGGYSAEVLD